MRKLDHENVVNMHDVIDDVFANKLYMVIDYCKARRRRRHRRRRSRHRRSRSRSRRSRRSRHSRRSRRSRSLSRRWRALIR